MQIGSSLFTEAELFLRGIYRKISAYEAVLAQLANGTNEVSRISGKTGFSDTNVSQALFSFPCWELFQNGRRSPDAVGKGWKITDSYFASAPSSCILLSGEDAEKPHLDMR